MKNNATATPSKQLCTFYLNELFFGIEVTKVQEVLRYQDMAQVPLAPRVVQGLMNLRGQIVTAVDLRRRLELPERPTGYVPMNIVVHTEGGPVSFLIDAIGDVLEVNEETFEPSPQTMVGVSKELILGAYKLKDRLLLVLNTEKVLTLN